MGFSFNPIRRGKLHMSLSGTTLTVAAVGKTLIEMPNASSPGLSVILDITGKSWSLDFAAFPANAGLGITTTVDWASNMPHFFYLGNEDNTAANVFAFNTRDPRMAVTPAAGLIHDTDALGGTADSQNHIMSWKADDAGIAAKPCVCLGSYCAQWETDAAPTADVWEIQTLTTNDGIGLFQEGVQFTMPNNQNGCATATQFFDEAGATTTLAFNSPAPYYYIRRDGSVLLDYTTSTRSAGDVSASAIRVYLPYAAKGFVGTTVIGVLGGAGAHVTWFSSLTTAGLSYVVGQFTINGGATSAINVASYGNAADKLFLQGIYQAF